jgi:hypothetical protein
MSAAHTPGPWRVNTDDLSSSVYGYVFSETMAICRVFLDGNECEANIRLIAAAPDLLEALKDMIEIFKDVPEAVIVNYDEPEEPKTQWDYDAFNILWKARSAFSKATGAAS